MPVQPVPVVRAIPGFPKGANQELLMARCAEAFERVREEQEEDAFGARKRVSEWISSSSNPSHSPSPYTPDLPEQASVEVSSKLYSSSPPNQASIEITSKAYSDSNSSWSS